ncbi:MAG: MFS transporter [Candidatus Heimdallarchaeota archaeon]|nr:MFS transporter [Candidatus Heimdallarchaeota archaeon]
MPSDIPPEEEQLIFSGTTPEMTSLDIESNEIIDVSIKNLEKIPEREKLYSRTVLTTFSAGMVDPFLTTIAIDMGITGSLMGWLRAITNLLGNFAQPFFGFFSDKVRRRTLFISISNILYSSTWIVLLFINNVIFLIVMAGFLSLVASFGTPAWTALLGEVIPSKIRGKILANVNWFSQFSSIASTILGGLLLNNIDLEISIGSWKFQLNILLTISIGLVAGFVAAFVIFSFNEKKARERAQLLSNQIMKNESSLQKEIDLKECEVEPILINDKDPQKITSTDLGAICISSEKAEFKGSDEFLTYEKALEEKSEFSNRISIMLRDKNFINFTLIFGIQSFFMSFCWPLFPIRQRTDVGADYFGIAVFSVTMTIATLLTVRYAGQVSDLIGRKPQMFLNRLILATMPLGYMFSSKVWHIILMHALICIPLGLNSSVMQAYLIDITPEEDRSMYIGFYNMFYGIILFLGSLAGGYLVDFLMGELILFGYTPAFEDYKAVTIAFAVGFIGRLLTAFPFLALKEVKQFPLTLKELPKKVFRSKKFPVLIITIFLFFAILIGFMFLMGYLP